jgi:uncharacterized protein (DUF2236 family)
MQSPLQEDHVSFVSRSDSEALLAAVVSRGNDARAGLFAPDSTIWKVDREAALFLAAGRAALLQLAHPWVATAIEQHSTVLANPIARFHNTFRIVFTVVFGSRDQAIRAARHLYTLHTQIRGEMTEGVAAYGKGSRYEANEIGALRWVYATLVDSAVLAYESAIAPLTGEEREAYYAETKTMAALFGIPSDALPENWDDFVAYVNAMVQSNSLGVTQAARSMAQRILAGAGSWIHPPRWYRTLTTMWLPERFREEFDFELRPADRLDAERALRRFSRIYRRLPDSIRFVGPWHEAHARLAGRGVGVLTLLNNRFWIGQSRVLFGEEGHGPF